MGSAVSGDSLSFASDIFVEHSPSSSSFFCGHEMLSHGFLETIANFLPMEVIVVPGACLLVSL